MKTTPIIYAFPLGKWLIVSCCSGLLFLAAPAMGQPMPPLSSAPASNNLWQTVAASLESGELDRVDALLQEARSEAGRAKDKEAKARITEAQRQVRKFYDPLFENLYWANDQRQKGAWRNVQIELNEALQRIQDHQQGGMPEFSQVDQRLADRVRQEHQLATQQRQSIYLQRVRQGEQLLWSQNYQQAIPALEEAAALLLPGPEQAELDRIGELIRQARFRQFIAQGEEAEQKGDFRGALDPYLQAQELIDNAEVQQKIQEVKDRLHFTLLQEAQDDFLAGRYAQSAAKLDESAGYRSSDYLDRLRAGSYQQLRDAGDAAFSAGQYDRALEAYQNARLFLDDDAIRASIDRAKNVSAYHAELARADDLIEQGKLPAARRRLKRAARYDNTEEVQQRLTRLATYSAKLKQGKSMLKTDANAAYRLFAEAYQLFPTAEARDWLARAEAAGASGEPVGGRDFFKI